MQEFQQSAEEAARRAGAVLQSWARRFTVREKSRANLVTEADLAAQETIYEFLRGRYPEHNFLGEENLSRSDGLSPYRWVIDPLDGTSNYVHGFPYYAVSIALEKSGQLVVGVIFDPNRDELFAATRGHGATLNGTPIESSDVTALAQAMLVASLPVATTPHDPAVRKFLHVMPHAQTVQRTGSAALNLAYVAAGRIDGFWSSSLKPWDMAAGALIVTEAGGHVSRVDGRPLDIAIPDLLATNGTAVHAQLSELLQEVTG